MKEMNIFEATAMTSPNPLTLICTRQADGSTNLAPICFVSYLSFNPPMFGFATGKSAQTGVNARERGEAIVTVPGETLSQKLMSCGASSGRNTNKVEAFDIAMKPFEGSEIQIPEDSRLAIRLKLNQAIEVGDHILHVCDVEKILGDPEVRALFAWNGFAKAAPAVEG